jgi:predicted metal-dependent hydrolase
MSEDRLMTIFKSVQERYFHRSYKKIDVKYHRFRSLKHTLEWTPWRIRIKVNEHFKNAPDSILENLAIILLARIYKVRVGKEIRNPFNEYNESLRATLPAKKFNRYDSYSGKGRKYDLSSIFDQLNQIYFSNNLQMPVLGWSKKKSFWRLGFYDKERNLLVISRVFDQAGVPEKVVRYLVFHEMLHIYFPAQRKNGRRIIHSRKFRETEKQFPEYEEIQGWINRNLKKL